MARNVTISTRAFADLVDARAWYSQRGAGARARRRVGAIERAIEALARTPCMWSHGDQEGTRERFIERHFMVYEVVPDTGRDQTAGDVIVLRVFGPGQDRARL